MTVIQNEKNKSNTLIIVLIIFASSFWGCSYIAGKIATPYISPSVLGFLRFFVSTIALLCICFKKKLSLKIELKMIFPLILLTLTGFVLFNYFIQLGLQTVAATRTSLLATTPPFFITIGAIIFFKEKMNTLRFIGMLLSIIGASLIVSDGNYSDIMSTLTIGDWYVITAMFMWVSYVLLGRKTITSINAYVSTTLMSIFATIIFSPLAYYELKNFDNTFNIEVMLSAIYLGLCCTVLAFVWFADGIKVLGAARASVYLNFEPVAALFFGFLLLGESVSITMVIGAIITLFGVYLTNFRV